MPVPDSRPLLFLSAACGHENPPRQAVDLVRNGDQGLSGTRHTTLSLVTCHPSLSWTAPRKRVRAEEVGYECRVRDVSLMGEPKSHARGNDERTCTTLCTANC